MDWDQIESKWAVMARRIRADVRCGKIDESLILLHRVDKAEGAASGGVRQCAAVVTSISQKREPASTR